MTPAPDTAVIPDLWSEWLLHRRHGNSKDRAADLLPVLDQYASRVLDAAHLTSESILIDIGTGTGLIAFEAIRRIGPGLRVILTDISAALLAHARETAGQRQITEQCQFILCPADDLSALPDGCADVVTTRSVLAYVNDKPRALSEFFRVLKPGGRLSCAEPIFRDDAFKILTMKNWLADHPDHPGAPYLRQLHQWKSVQYPDTLERIAASPLTNYSERDLFNWTIDAGFLKTHVELHLEAGKQKLLPWDEYIECSPHPLAPTLREILSTHFSAEQRLAFEQTMRPLLAAQETDSIERMIYITGIKPSDAVSGAASQSGS